MRSHGPPWAVLVVFLVVALALLVLMTRVLLWDAPWSTAHGVQPSPVEDLRRWAPPPETFEPVPWQSLVEEPTASVLDGRSIELIVIPRLVSQEPGTGALLLLGTPERPLPAWFPGDARARGSGPQRIRGVYRHDSGSLFIHQMEPVLPFGCPVDPEAARGMAFALGGGGVLLLILGFLMQKGRRFSPAPLLVMGAVLAGGCEIQVATILSEDNHAVFETRLLGDAKETAFMLGLPNFEGYVQAWKSALESRGYVVEVQRPGGGLSFRLQRPPVRASAVPADAPEGKSWTSMVAERQTGFSVQRVLARISTAEILSAASAAGDHPMIRQAVTKVVKEFRFSVAMQIPTEPTFHNADRQNGATGRGEWSIPMGEDRLLVMESTVSNPREILLFQAGLTVGLVGLTGAVTGLVFALLRSLGVRL